MIILALIVSACPIQENKPAADARDNHTVIAKPAGHLQGTPRTRSQCSHNYTPLVRIITTILPAPFSNLVIASRRCALIAGIARCNRTAVSFIEWPSYFSRNTSFWYAVKAFIVSPSSAPRLHRKKYRRVCNTSGN